ncbi:MAG: choice-of-anchor Q domain-containing protein [Candidatus Nanopelagicales bacterium]|nr:choice-of-anchor Q domain-containing protein [Candidatus Nanopelagicales bacterium]
MGKSSHTRGVVAVGIAAGLVAVALAVGAGAGEVPDRDPPEVRQAGIQLASAPSPDRGVPTSSSKRGPRKINATFVPLEVPSFPRKAAKSCADNTRIVNVPSSRARNIAQGLSAATPGTTVRVRAGTYTEQPGEWFALELAKNNICLRSRGGRVVIRAASGQRYGLLLSGSSTVIQGIKLKGFSSGISLGAAEGSTQRRVTIQGVVVVGGGAWRDGIIAYTDNRGVPGQPPAVDGLLLNNVKVRRTDIGIACNAGPCAHWWLDHVRVKGRVSSEDSGADTFAIEEGRQIAVIDSTFVTASADGIDTKAEDVLVYRSAVYNAARNAIKLWHGGDVINTVVDGSGADAALVGDAAGRYRYAHVIVTRHSPGGTGYVGTWGYDGNPALRLEIVNSIFSNNASGGLYVPSTAGTSVNIRRNLFSDRGEKFLDAGGTVYLITSSGLSDASASGHGSGNRIGSPLFVKRAAHNYATTAGSLARDAAVSIPALTSDFLGRPRVLGPGPDIGAVESRR